MDVHAGLDADVPVEALFGQIESLDDYDRWLEIVPSVAAAAPAGGDVGPAWDVTLRGRLGPLARSKRIRMVRTELRPPSADGPGRVVFTRGEVDGREHSPWVLTVEVGARPTGGSHLDMHLHYGGGLWVPLLDRLLAGEIEASRRRLLAILDAS